MSTSQFPTASFVIYTLAIFACGAAFTSSLRPPTTVRDLIGIVLPLAVAMLSARSLIQDVRSAGHRGGPASRGLTSA